METDHLYFNDGTAVRFGGNTFIDVPIILQVDEVPIIETVREQHLSRTTSFSIFDPDGTYLAKAVGPRLFLTEEGRKAGLKLRHPDKMTVCELGNRTLFEVKRPEAAAIALTAELYTPQGIFVKANAAVPFGTFSNNNTQIGGCIFSENVVQGIRIGYLLKSDGSLRFGCQ
jgi:hypothetical protein